MADTPALSGRADGQASIRNEPVQARSTARLAALLDATAYVVDQVGYERLTTAMVAERAGASIGTVYRYFPERIAVLQSLGARNAERVGGRVLAALAEHRHQNWSSALDAGLEVYADAFRSEPGFASLRLGDVLDLRPVLGPPALRTLSERAASVLIDRFSMADGAEARLALQSAFTLSDAIAADAFRGNSHGDAAALRQASVARNSVLKEYFPAAAR